MNICMYGASSALIDRKYLDAAFALGRELAQRGHTLYFGGGASGVMGAAAEGAYGQGGRIVGVVPSFFHVDGILFPHSSEIIYTETMGERKHYLETHADAFIAAPGGIGTYDEFFGCITNKQLGIHNKPVTVLNTGDYYAPVRDLLEHTTKNRFLGVPFERICRFFEEVTPLLDYIESYTPAYNPDSFC